MSMVEPLLAAGADVNIQDEEGQTPLHLAFNTDVVLALIHAGADVNQADSSGDTPLIRIAKRNYEKDAVEITATLLKAGADPNHRNGKLETALLVVLRGCANAAGSIGNEKITDRYMKIARLLLEAGAEIDAKSRKGDTPAEYIRQPIISGELELVLK